MATAGLWLTEGKASGLVIKSKVKEVFLADKSKDHQIRIVDLEAFGRSVILNGALEYTCFDDRIYHESLVHPALCAHPNPKTVLILGCNIGATVREVFRFKSIEKCVGVDNDEVVHRHCREHLREQTHGAFDNPKFHMIISDVEDFVKESHEKFDVIVFDLPEPHQGNSWRMYTQEFYEQASNLLNKDGIFVSHCGPSSLYFLENVFSPVQNTLKAVFAHVRPYSTFLPSSLDSYGFAIASNDIDFSTLTAEIVEQKLAEVVQGENVHYDGETHNHMFHLPKHIRERFATETRVRTLQNSHQFVTKIK